MKKKAQFKIVYNLPYEITRDPKRKVLDPMDPLKLDSLILN